MIIPKEWWDEPPYTVDTAEWKYDIPLIIQETKRQERQLILKELNMMYNDHMKVCSVFSSGEKCACPEDLRLAIVRLTPPEKE